jgi:hypothetical protein
MLGLGRVTTSVGQVRGARAGALGAPAAPRRGRASPPSIAQLYRRALDRAPALSTCECTECVVFALVNNNNSFSVRPALYFSNRRESSPCVGTTRRNDIAIGTRIPRV